MTNIAGIQFQRAGRIYDYHYRNIALEVGDEVLVDGPKGEAIGRISILKFEHFDPDDKSASTLKKVLRKVSASSISEVLYPGDDQAKRVTQDIVARLKLDMNVTQCQLQGMTKQKVLIFFMSSERVDFRKLVKELAAQFKMRIELRQIGPRDQAKLVGGVGICGREFCCSSFLRQFIPVSIKMAKNQNLALNPNQVSGGCGRLLCCLSYENNIYTELKKTLPKVGGRVQHKYAQISAQVLSLDVLNQKVVVRDDEGAVETYPVADLTFQRTTRRQPRSSDPTKSSASRTVTWGEDLDVASLIQFQDQLETSS